jgi:hypothetical protein
MHPPLPLWLDGAEQESTITASDKNSTLIDAKD